MKRTSGVITMPPALPSRLLGSLAAEVGDDGGAWILAGVFRGDEYLGLEENGGRSTLAIRRELMDTFLGALTIQLAATRWMRPGAPPDVPDGESDCVAVEIVVARRSQPGMVRCSWPTGTAGIEWSDAEDQVNVRFRADVAQALVERLAQELGRVAAWVADNPA